MPSDSNSDTALATTLRQLVNAIQLMQAAVDTLNVVIEANTDMSHVLTSALSEIIFNSRVDPVSESAPTDLSTVITAPSVPLDTAPSAPTTPSTPTATSASLPLSAAQGIQSPAERDRVLRILNAMLTPAETPAETDTTPWYSVIVGRNPGVFYGPNGIAQNLERIPGAKVVRYPTGRQSARDGFNAQLAAGTVERVQLNITRTVLQPGDTTIPGLE